MAMISTKLVSLAILCFLIVSNSCSASRAARVLSGKPPADGSGSLGGASGSRPRQDGSHFGHGSPSGTTTGHGSPSGTTTGGGLSYARIARSTNKPSKAACSRDKPGRYYSCVPSAEGGKP